jgi:hypothetical protein
MKSFIQAVIAAAVLAAPAVSFAQQVAPPSNGPVTRAEVRADLVAVEKAGYNPNDAYHYPENIQAAEQKVQAQQVAAAQMASTSEGASTNGSSQSGRPAATADTRSIYFGH